MLAESERKGKPKKFIARIRVFDGRGRGRAPEKHRRYSYGPAFLVTPAVFAAGSLGTTLKRGNPEPSRRQPAPAADAMMGCNELELTLAAAKQFARAFADGAIPGVVRVPLPGAQGQMAPA